MPIAHACSQRGCETLTMGELCLDHERERKQLWSLRLPPLIGSAATLVAAAAVGALLKHRFS